MLRTDISAKKPGISWKRYHVMSRRACVAFALTVNVKRRALSSVEILIDHNQSHRPTDSVVSAASFYEFNTENATEWIVCENFSASRRWCELLLTDHT